MSEAAFRRVFLIGALWNVVGGIFILLATGWVFRSAGLAPPSPPVYYYSWIALFMTFGLGYYLVYRDPRRNRDIALLGAIGKLGFAAIFLYGYGAWPGTVPLFFLVPVAGDVVFAVLFILFLGFLSRKVAS